jgi:predicted dienelactone hydrolase
VTAIGFRQGVLQDTTRPNWDGNAPRPLSWLAWYPTSSDAVERELVIDPTQTWFKVGPAARDAPVDESRRRYPVVLLSHGTGGAALNQEWLARDLAGHGFIAIGVNHHGNTSTEPYRAEAFLCWWERARDLTVLLDHVAAHGEFAGRIDMDRLFIAGYSLGGCTALALLGAITETSRFQASPDNKDFARGPREFPDLADRLPGLIENSAVFQQSWASMTDSYRDERFKAAFLLAPGRSITGFNEASLRSIATPIHIVVGGSDFVLPAVNWLHPRLPTSRLDLLAPEASHHVFLPEATEAGRRADPEVCIDPPSIDRRAIHQRAATLAAELFESV